MTLRFRTELQRKDPDLPVFVRVPGAIVAPWQLTEWKTVEGSLNGHDFGRRTIKDWGKDSPRLVRRVPETLPCRRGS